MAFKMKGSHHYGKGNTSPNKFLGKVAKGIGGALKGAVMGKDGMRVQCYLVFLAINKNLNLRKPYHKYVLFVVFF